MYIYIYIYIYIITIYNIIHNFICTHIYEISVSKKMKVDVGLLVPNATASPYRDREDIRLVV